MLGITRATSTSAGRRRAGAIVVTAGLLISSFAGTSVTAAAATSSVNAVGSVEQVYVTGLTPGAQASLLGPAGEPLKTQTVNSLGGLLFREVPPGEGYRVESEGVQSDPLVVHNDDPAPWDPSIYNQSIPSQRLPYLTTRDGTKLALTRAPADEPRHPPRSQASGAATGWPRRPVPSAVPDADRVLGLRVRQARWPAERHRRPRERDGLRRRRHPDARDRLLGRRLRLLRAAAEPRRLRHRRDDRQPAVGQGQQGRHDGDLLRRYQPAVHRAAPAAVARGDLSAVGPRRNCDDALSRRQPQHRLRRRLGRGASEGSTGRRPRAGPADTPGTGSRTATRPVPRTRRCTPRPQTWQRRSTPTLTTFPRSPIRSTP